MTSKKSSDHRKNNEEIEQEVLKTMQSFDGLEPAKMDTFFFTRLEARMDAERVQKTNVMSLLFEPKLAMSAVALLFLVTVNIVSVNTYIQLEEETSTSTELTTAYEDYIIDVPILYTENGE